MKPLLVLVLVLFVACGDSATVTKTEYIGAANTLCSVANTETERINADIAAQVPAEPTVEEAGLALQLSLERSTPIFEAVLADLRALPRPDGDDELLGTLFADMETARAQIIDAAREYAEGNPAVPEYLAGPDQPFVDVNQRLAAYGLTECG